MDSKERVFRTIRREPVDRPAIWLGEPTSGAIANLERSLSTRGIDEIKENLGDDIFNFNIPYNSPVADHIVNAFDFAKKGVDGQSYEERTLTAPGFFEDFEDPSRVDEFPWPDPALYIDREEVLRRVKSIPNGKASMVMSWSAHFQDSCSAFGMETALAKMMLEPEMYKAVIDRITQFYLKASEIVYETTKGYLDIVLIGNDFGSQRNLMVSPQLLRDLVFDGTKELIDQAHAYGLLVVHHSCGSIFPIIPDIIQLGADAIHPIQARAKDMEAEKLKAEFGGKASFVGGVDAQYLLVQGTAGDVRQRTRELIELFPTGLVVSPSHEAVLPDVPVENVLAMFEATLDAAQEGSVV
jgi:uroporphyrinogen decarboxylase